MKIRCLEVIANSFYEKKCATENTRYKTIAEIMQKKYLQALELVRSYIYLQLQAATMIGSTTEPQNMNSAVYAAVRNRPYVQLYQIDRRYSYTKSTVCTAVPTPPALLHRSCLQLLMFTGNWSHHVNPPTIEGQGLERTSSNDPPLPLKMPQ